MIPTSIPTTPQWTNAWFFIMVEDSTERDIILKINWHRIWLGSLLFVFIAVVLTIAINEKVGLNIAWSFLNGEASIGFWRKQGMPFGWSIAIGAACSTYDTISWFFLFRWLHRIYPKSIQPIYERLYGDGTIIENARTPWLTKAHRVGARIYKSCVPQTEENPSYWPLVFYGLCPGTIGMGIGYIVASPLKNIPALLVICTADIVKIVIFGSFSLVLNRWTIVALIVGALIAHKRIQTRSERSEVFTLKPEFEPSAED